MNLVWIMKRIGIFCVCIAMLLMCSCGANKNEEESTSEDSENEFATGDTSPEDTTIEFYQTDEETYAINTPYCKLYYPIKWAELVETSVSEAESFYEVSFYAELEGSSIPLFNVTFGEGSEGYLLGKLETDEGEIKVFLSVFSDDYNGSLSAEAEGDYYQMCEDINVIISKLVYENGLVLE